MATDTDEPDELLLLLLEICEDFFARSSPATHAELDLFLRSRGITGGPGWLIDMLGLTRLRLPQRTTAPSAAGTAPETFETGYG